MLSAYNENNYGIYYMLQRLKVNNINDFIDTTIKTDTLFHEKLTNAEKQQLLENKINSAPLPYNQNVQNRNDWQEALLVKYFMYQRIQAKSLKEEAKAPKKEEKKKSNKEDSDEDSDKNDEKKKFNKKESDEDEGEKKEDEGVTKIQKKTNKKPKKANDDIGNGKKKDDKKENQQEPISQDEDISKFWKIGLDDYDLFSGVIASDINSQNYKILKIYKDKDDEDYDEANIIIHRIDTENGKRPVVRFYMPKTPETLVADWFRQEKENVNFYFNLYGNCTSIDPRAFYYLLDDLVNYQEFNAAPIQIEYNIIKPEENSNEEHHPNDEDAAEQNGNDDNIKSEEPSEKVMEEDNDKSNHDDDAKEESNHDDDAKEVSNHDDDDKGSNHDDKEESNHGDSDDE